MGSRHAFLAALERVIVFVCGLGLAYAIGAHLYICAVLLVLIASWTIAHSVWNRPARPAIVPLPPVADPAEALTQIRLLRSMVDQTPAPLLTLHPDGAIRAANRAARRLFGVEDRLVTPLPELTAALRHGAPEHRLTVRLAVGAELRAYAISIADLTGPGGQVRLAAMLDIEPEIRAAEAAALRDLMQVLSHEIMNALTPVASLAATARDLLSEEDSEQAKLARDAVATLARRAEGLTRFVEAYRTLARLPAPTLSRVSLGDLLDEVAQMFHGRWAPKGVSLNLVKAAPDVILDLDLDLMVHALSNVVSNGAEAAFDSETPAVTLAAHVHEGHPRLVIEDNGPGVPACDRDLVFDPFFTTKPDGSGVGLSFARQVALSHGGDLLLAPAASGRGAKFIITF